ncbi:hypothetical protein [Lysinibacter cavernae]|uniref:AsnC family protein n=1 Tax=Lysinibacter cavernae TaxID=1640652 RepID=A0A7X5TVG8_9MICO|nr:hypothetical protein [Lysinibacter cavernae]NIH55192.1 hypothetical protein [Lysinibacter cavernae]
MSITTINGLADNAGAENPLEALAAVAELRRELDRYEATVVRRARMAGISWQFIATALGVSKQAVHKKYGRQ